MNIRSCQRIAIVQGRCGKGHGRWVVSSVIGKEISRVPASAALTATAHSGLEVATAATIQAKRADTFYPDT
jgi:hypothetical protein